MSNPRFQACYHCNNRVVGCHSTCEVYKKEQEERATIKSERQRQIKHSYGAAKVAQVWGHTPEAWKNCSTKKR